MEMVTGLAGCLRSPLGPVRSHYGFYGAVICVYSCQCLPERLRFSPPQYISTFRRNTPLLSFGVHPCTSSLVGHSHSRLSCGGVRENTAGVDFPTHRGESHTTSHTPLPFIRYHSFSLYLSVLRDRHVATMRRSVGVWSTNSIYASSIFEPFSQPVCFLHVMPCTAVGP